MEVEQIRSKVKDVITQVTGIPVDQITDEASFIDDLGLDSLTLLEIGVDVDFQFSLNVPDEELKELGTVNQTVVFVQQRLVDRGAEAEVA